MKFLEKHRLSVILISIALFVAWLCLAIIFASTLFDIEDPNEVTKSFFIRLGILILICPYWFPFIIYIVIPVSKKEESIFMEVTFSEYQIIQNYRSSKELKNKLMNRN